MATGSSHHYYSIDGTEYDPFASQISTCTPTIDVFAISANDSGVSDTINLQMDWIKLGVTSYGSTDVLYDDFVSSGFPGWTYNPGSPSTVLTQSGSVATLAFTGDLIGNPDIEHVFTSAYVDFFALMRVKCTSPVHTSSRSPGYSSFSGGANVTINYYSDGVRMNLASTLNSFTPVNLADGNWHEVGYHQVFTGCGFAISGGVHLAPINIPYGNAPVDRRG